jgi:hypothetical protein
MTTVCAQAQLFEQLPSLGLAFLTWINALIAILLLGL